MLSRRESRILALLVISGFLNYVDRANLSVGLTNIQSELHLAPYQLGVLQSAFFWTYACFQLFAISGWLVDRFNVCWVLAAGFFLWSGATAVTGLAHVFGLIFALRLLLGIGESVAYPSYSRILANNFPEYHRGLANALIDAGTKAGPALGTLLGGLLIADFGWRPFFLLLGVASLLWLVPWIVWMPSAKGVAAIEDPGAMPSMGAVLRQRPVWFTSVGLFCSNYFWYFLITWLPYYLEKSAILPKIKWPYTARCRSWPWLFPASSAAGSRTIGSATDTLPPESARPSPAWACAFRPSFYRWPWYTTPNWPWGC